MPGKALAQQTVSLKHIRNVVIALDGPVIAVQAPYIVHADGQPIREGVVAVEADSDPGLDAAVDLLLKHVVLLANEQEATALSVEEAAAVDEEIAEKKRPKGAPVEPGQVPAGDTRKK